MCCMKLLIQILLLFSIIKPSLGGGFCSTKMQNGKFASKGDDCVNQHGSLVLRELDAKLNPAQKEKACYLGMKSGEIPDHAITSSTLWRSYYPASLGRLDSKVGWLPAWSQRGQWIQADFGESKLVAGVITQGRFNAALWVTSFKIFCGSHTWNLQAITEHGADKIFSGNSDQNTKVVNKFPQPVTCRYIRVYPETWSGYRLSMRVEFIRGNCYNKY